MKHLSIVPIVCVFSFFSVGGGREEEKERREGFLTTFSFSTKLSGVHIGQILL